MVHEIWMLFILPANPDFSGHTPSAGQRNRWQKRRKATEINLPAFLLEHRQSQHGHKLQSVCSFLSQERQKKHIITIHKQKDMHTQARGKTIAYLSWSVFTWKPEGAVKAHKLAYFACTWEPAKHFSLLSIILIAQHDSSTPNLPTPPPHPQPDGFFFFF